MFELEGRRKREAIFAATMILLLIVAVLALFQGCFNSHDTLMDQCRDDCTAKGYSGWTYDTLHKRCKCEGGKA